MADEPTTEPAPGTSLVAFGGPLERPETTHWEQELWSENPGMPPSAVGPDDPVLRGAGDNGPAENGDISHRTLLDAATSVVDEAELEPGDRVIRRGDLTDPAALAAGVVVPLATGATAVLAGRDAGGRGANRDRGGTSRRPATNITSGGRRLVE